MRTIDQSEVTEELGMARTLDTRGMDGLAEAVLQFTRVEDFTTFLAEYVFKDGDIVVHFFPPPEAYEMSALTKRMSVKPDFMRRWTRVFPEVLSPTAESYFGATRPVLEATYVAEMTSWWLRAGGFARRLGPEEFLRGFFVELDAKLDGA